MRDNDFKIGLMLSNRSPVMGYGSASQLLSFGMAAEQSGVVDHLWVGDSLLAKPRLEALSMLAALSTCTSKIHLGTAALASLPLRNPILLALQLATIDQISKGRLILGTSIGGAQLTRGAFNNEFTNFGVDPRKRAGRLEEAITLLRMLWSGKEITFHGEHWNYEQVVLGVRPHQQDPPIWLVSSPFETGKPLLIERGLRRVARLADGWMASRLTPAQFQQGSDMIDKYALDYDRNPLTIQRCFVGHMLIHPNINVAFKESRDWLNAYYISKLPDDTVKLWTGMGTAEQCAEWLIKFKEAGAQHALIRFASFDWEGQLAMFLDEVIPLIKTHI